MHLTCCLADSQAKHDSKYHKQNNAQTKGARLGGLTDVNGHLNTPNTFGYATEEIWNRFLLRYFIWAK